MKVLKVALCLLLFASPAQAGASYEGPMFLTDRQGYSGVRARFDVVDSSGHAHFVAMRAMVSQEGQWLEIGWIDAYGQQPALYTFQSPGPSSITEYRHYDISDVIAVKIVRCRFGHCAYYKHAGTWVLLETSPICKDLKGCAYDTQLEVAGDFDVPEIDVRVSLRKNGWHAPPFPFAVWADDPQYLSVITGPRSFTISPLSGS